MRRRLQLRLLIPAGLVLACSLHLAVREYRRDCDKVRCRELQQQLAEVEPTLQEIGTRREYGHPEYRMAVERVQPVIAEYRALQRKHPEWEGTPQ